MVAKARRRKLHVSELDAALLQEAGMTIPLRPALMDINKYLPPDIHYLRRSVRLAPKEKGYNSFVWDGDVSIRKKKEDRATRVTSVNELKNFLEGSQ